MATEGLFTARAYSSYAQLPVADAYITVTRAGADGGTVLEANLKTDKSGLTAPFMLSAPSEENSKYPDKADAFAVYDVSIYHPLYYSVNVKNIQIFGGGGSTLPFELIPVAEDKNPSSTVQRVDITPQNL